MASLATERSEAAATHEVLVIEDDADLQEMLAGALSPFGYVTRSVSGGVEGLSLLRADRDRFCLVLLDLGLSGMNGFELLAEQSNDPTIDDIPVIVMSGRDAIDERHRPKAWVHTLHKPMSVDELVDSVAKFAR